MKKDVKKFLKVQRKGVQYRPVCERIKDYKEVASVPKPSESKEQASRCMDCGTPFCHWGCPVGNYIPEWNDFAMQEQWQKAFTILNETNNLPEITGRVCPATCEYACVLGINDDPVTIRENELAIIEYAFQKGFIKPLPPKLRTGKRIAVVGSGPAGMAAAAQLNRAGHNVTVFEKDKRIGGIMRYGIPDFKLEKWILDRRIKLMEQEGIEFKTGINVGVDLSVKQLKEDFDAVVLTIGSRTPRDLKIPGRELKGIHFAMDYLIQNNKRVDGEKTAESEVIDAKAKHVVVIGGGDTGSDCMGTANRQGAACVVQIEVMPKPPRERTDDHPWPNYPLLLKTSSSHEEGGERHWTILTKKFIGENGKLKKLSCVQVEFAPVMKEIPGSEFEIEADMAILAVGFLHPEHSGLVKELNLELDNRGNIKSDDKFMTSQKGIFSAGDAHRGQSLIVWAISEGRTAAHHIDEWLMGSSSLPII